MLCPGALQLWFQACMRIGRCLLSLVVGLRYEKLIPFVILWSAWSDRNARNFKEKVSQVEDVAQLVLMRLGKWASSCKEFGSLRVDSNFHIWKATLRDVPPKVAKSDAPLPPPNHHHPNTQKRES